MCECGCTSSDDRYTLPAPGESFYLVTLSGHCVSCDAPAGVSIERIDPGNSLYEEYKNGEFNHGPLPLENWGDSVGAAIIVGLRKHEFTKATSPHLVGVDSRELGEDGVLDECGAEVIADEMYEDAQVRPTLVVPVSPTPQ